MEICIFSTPFFSGVVKHNIISRQRYKKGDVHPRFVLLAHLPALLKTGGDGKIGNFETDKYTGIPTT